MRILDFFRKNKVKLTEEEKKLDKMWELWVEGQIDSPYLELMTYQAEVNNGGHDQYFLNVGNTGDLEKEMTSLYNILPVKHKNNLQEAYKAYLIREEKEDDEDAEEIMEQCDDLFYENQEEINSILEEYAAKIEL